MTTKKQKLNEYSKQIKPKGRKKKYDNKYKEKQDQNHENKT